MPITKGAIRKQKADRVKARSNNKTKLTYRDAVSVMRRKPSEAQLKKVFSTLDRAAKKSVIHKNKAARLKSRLAALLKSK